MLHEAELRTPIDLAALSFDESSVLDDVREAVCDIVLLWQTALCWKEGDRKTHSLFLTKRETESYALISQLMVDSINDTSVFKDWDRARLSLGLPEDFDSLLPLPKSRLSARSGNRPSGVEQFLELGDNVNILRSAGGSLRFLSSGLALYANFCSLINRPFMRPTEKSVLIWSATFDPGLFL